MMCECVTSRSAVPTSQGYLLYRQMRGPDHERLMPLMSIVANSISFHGINHNWLDGWNGQDDCRCCRVSSCPYFLHALIGRRRGEDWENRWRTLSGPSTIGSDRSGGEGDVNVIHRSFVCSFARIPHYSWERCELCSDKQAFNGHDFERVGVFVVGDDTNDG